MNYIEIMSLFRLLVTMNDLKHFLNYIQTFQIGLKKRSKEDGFIKN